MYLNYTMNKPNINTIWYIEYNSFFIQFGWENIHENIFSDTVFLKDTLIEIKGKFYKIGLPLKLSIDVSSGTFLYQMITPEKNFSKNTEWCHLPTHVT